MTTNLRDPTVGIEKEPSHNSPQIKTMPLMLNLKQPDLKKLKTPDDKKPKKPRNPKVDPGQGHRDIREFFRRKPQESPLYPAPDEMDPIQSTSGDPAGVKVDKHCSITSKIAHKPNDLIASNPQPLKLCIILEQF